MKLTVLENISDTLLHIIIPSFAGKPEDNKKEGSVTFDKPPSYNWNNEELSRTPKWVGNNMWLGNYGERIAQNFLNDQGVIVTKKGDRKGYDLENKKDGTVTGYEVKTTSRHLSFFMSANELNAASKMKENYILFFICVHKEKEILDGYFIPDPVNTLNLPAEQMLKRQGNTVTITNASFKIDLTEKILEELLHHNLTPWKKIKLT